MRIPSAHDAPLSKKKPIFLEYERWFYCLFHYLSLDNENFVYKLQKKSQFEKYVNKENKCVEAKERLWNGLEYSCFVCLLPKYFSYLFSYLHSHGTAYA